MKLHSWQQIPIEQTNPTFARQVIHTGRMTVAYLHLQRGGVVPAHHHENEQVSMVLEGKLQFFAEGKDYIVSAGEVMEIPSNVVHSVIALEDSVVYDLFAPPRADWIRGDDAYLRQSPSKT